MYIYIYRSKHPTPNPLSLEPPFEGSSRISASGGRRFEGHSKVSASRIKGLKVLRRGQPLRESEGSKALPRFQSQEDEEGSKLLPSAILSTAATKVNESFNRFPHAIGSIARSEMADKHTRDKSLRKITTTGYYMAFSV